MAGLKTFSPEFLDVAITTPQGSGVVTGYAEGTFITMSPFAERFVPVYGAQGEPYRVRNAIKAFDVTLTLAQTSHWNDIFTQLLQNDIDTLDGTFNMTVKDSSGTTVFNDEFAYIGQEPEQAFSGGGTLESREWTIHMPSPQGYMIGGNSRFEADVQSLFEKLGGTVDPQWASS